MHEQRKYTLRHIKNALFMNKETQVVKPKKQGAKL